MDSSLAGRIYNIYPAKHHGISFCVWFSPGEADGAETLHHPDHSWIPEGSWLIAESWKPHHAMELAQAWQLKPSFLDKKNTGDMCCSSYKYTLIYAQWPSDTPSEHSQAALPLARSLWFIMKIITNLIFSFLLFCSTYDHTADASKLYAFTKVIQ